MAEDNISRITQVRRVLSASSNERCDVFDRTVQYLEISTSAALTSSRVKRATPAIAPTPKHGFPRGSNY